MSNYPYSEVDPLSDIDLDSEVGLALAALIKSSPQTLMGLAEYANVIVPGEERLAQFYLVSTPEAFSLDEALFPHKHSPLNWRGRLYYLVTPDPKYGDLPNLPDVVIHSAPAQYRVLVPIQVD